MKYQFIPLPPNPILSGSQPTNYQKLKLMITKSFDRVLKKFSTSTLNSRFASFNGLNVPQPLQFHREYHYTKMPNGITVASQFMPGKIASICAFIKCGSRNETKQTSGTAHFLQHLHFKGTKKRSRDEIGLQVEAIGGNLNAFTSRELTCYSMSVFHKNLKQGVEIVGDIMTNSLYNNADVENERSTIHRQLIETQKANPLESTVELAHRGVFKDHQLGLPILGSIGNMKTISRDMIVKYHNDNYVGDNIIIAGCGNLRHEELVDYVERYFRVNKQGSGDTSNSLKPGFNEGMLFLESKFTDQVNVSMLYEAPSYLDSEFFAFLLLQKIMGDKPETDLQRDIMGALPSYRLQNMMSRYPWIEKQKGVYVAYKDTALFGNYYIIPPEKLQQLIKINQEGFQLYASKITEEELEKAKRKTYMEILSHMNHEDVIQDIGNNLIYYDRRVCQSEIAHRVNCFTTQDIQNVIKKLMGLKLQVTVWGNTSQLEKKYGQKIIR